MSTVSSLGLKLPKNFPKSLIDVDVDVAIAELQKKIDDLSSPDSIRKAKAHLKLINDAAASIDEPDDEPIVVKKKPSVVNDKPKKPKKAKKSEDVVEPPVPKKATKPKLEKKEGLPEKKVTKKKESDSVRHKLLVIDNSTCKRKSKENGIPNIVAGFFQEPAKPIDVLQDIIDKYLEIEPSPSFTFEADPKTYVMWYIISMYRKGRLVEA